MDLCQSLKKGGVNSFGSLWQAVSFLFLLDYFWQSLELTLRPLGNHFVLFGEPSSTWRVDCFSRVCEGKDVSGHNLTLRASSFVTELILFSFLASFANCLNNFEYLKRSVLAVVWHCYIPCVFAPKRCVVD